MARARNIKPGFFKNEDLAQCDPLARILFAGLWCWADKDGRLEDRPVRIKAEILPYDDIDVNALLDQLFERGFIIRYQVGKVKCIDIPTFEKHAKPHANELSSELPPPPKSGKVPKRSGKVPSTREEIRSFPHPSSPIPHPSSLNSSEPQADSEPPSVNGKNHSTTTARAGDPVNEVGALPVMVFPCSGPGEKEWMLSAEKLAEYTESFPGIDVHLESRKALQWCRDNAARRKTPRGMPAFLSRWFSKAQDRGGASPGPAGRKSESAEEILERAKAKQPWLTGTTPG